MPFSETYFRKWRGSALESIADANARRTIRHHFKESPTTAVRNVAKTLDDKTRNYAYEWERISNLHRDSGVYRKISEFIGEKDGLLIDLGCGTGNFLTQWSKTPAVGVDLNGYCLQLAEDKLKAKWQVDRYSDSTLEFNSKIGFELKPLPAHLRRGYTLLLDDITKLHITEKMLAEGETKADIVTFMLWGSYDVFKGTHFLDEERTSYETNSSAELSKKLVYELPRILKNEGTFYLGVRIDDGIMKALGQVGISMEKMFGVIAKDKGEVQRVATIELPQENGGSLIQVRHLIFNQNEQQNVLGLAEIKIKY
ncbi:hypothetical protein HYT53_01515 [Candidatus Woesearchaeota archaeon]|nr:hypothetical protein [Candidatus Woesearchaeota archaeon]